MDKDRKRNINIDEIYDPFAIELIISALSLASTIIGTYISYQSLSEQKKDRYNIEKELHGSYLDPFKSLLDQTSRLHDNIDKIIILIYNYKGNREVGEGDRKPRLKNGALYLDGTEYDKYSHIESSITKLLNDARELSAQVRKISISIPLSEHPYIDSGFVKNFDDLLDNLSDLTFAEISKKLRDILVNLEEDLKIIIHEHSHGSGKR
jgi:hypothetical protein